MRMVKVEIIKTGQVMEVPPDIAIELIFSKDGKLINDWPDESQTKEIMVDGQGHKVIRMICKDGVGITEN